MWFVTYIPHSGDSKWNQPNVTEYADFCDFKQEVFFLPLLRTNSILMKSHRSLLPDQMASPDSTVREKKDHLIFDYFVICLMFSTCPFHSHISRDAIWRQLLSAPPALKITQQTVCKPAPAFLFWKIIRSKLSLWNLCTASSCDFLILAKELP